MVPTKSRTLGTLIVSRMSLISNSCSVAGREMVTVTSVPFLPRRRRTASSMVNFSVVCPLILTMRSPGLMPPLLAGVPSIVSETVRVPPLLTPFVRTFRTMPTPPNAPSVSFLMSSYLRASMNSLCGSSELTMPLSAAWMSCW